MTRTPTRSVLLVAGLLVAITPWATASAGAPRAPRALPATRPAPPRTPTTLTFIPGELLVAIEGEAPFGLGPGGRLAPRDTRLGDALARHGLEVGERVGVPPAGSAWSFVRLRSSLPGFDPLAAAADLRVTGAFRAVTPNYCLRPLLTLPNDFYLGTQWYVYSGDNADIDLPLAWDVQKGSSSVTIAILDTGVDTGHPDLASKVWHNPGEIPGNGIDDDGNGFIDDDQGWDFGDWDNDPNPEPVFDAATGIDVGFHGTFCAGIASAATDNGEGIAGAGWNCRIMALKASDVNGNFTDAAIAAGMQYAAAMGAKVLSMSFGGPGDPGVPEFFQALVDDANAAGVMCIAAAGNDGNNLPVYPAACQHVLAVAATDENAARASFSNWGTYVDIAAPGSSMWSAICRNYVVDDYSQIFYEGLWLWDGTNPYMYGDGTSFACPLVAGVAGLLRSWQPGLTPDQAARHLVATGDFMSFDRPIGPKVNAFNAVNPALLAVNDEAARPRFALDPPSPNPSRAGAQLAFTLAVAGRARLTLLDCAGRQVRVLLDASLDPGPHRVRWDGAGADGRPLAPGLYLARLESAGRGIERKLVRLGR